MKNKTENLSVSPVKRIHLNISHGLEGGEQEHESESQDQDVNELNVHGHDWCVVSLGLLGYKKSTGFTLWTLDSSEWDVKFVNREI